MQSTEFDMTKATSSSSSAAKVVKNQPDNGDIARGCGTILGIRKIPRGKNGNPPSILSWEIPYNRGSCSLKEVHGVKRVDTSECAHNSTHI